MSSPAFALLVLLVAVDLSGARRQHILLRTLEASKASATITKAPEGGEKDNWNNPSNWDGGKVPSGTMSASVAKGLHVTVDSDATPAYTGELTMQAGSTLRLAWTSGHQGIARAVSEVSRIVMESGSEILSNLPRNIDFPPITLNGDASVTMPSTGVHGRSFSFKAIEGAHKFSLVSCHLCKYDFTAKSTVSEFVTNVIGTSELHAQAAGCFGPGDVSLNLGPTHGQVLKLFLGDSNAISSTATLSLTSTSSRFGQGEIEIALAAGVTQQVAALVVDGVSAKMGSYKAGVNTMGGATVTFVGDGELVVGSQATYVDLGPGCCLVDGEYLFNGGLGDLAACKAKCETFPDCGYIEHGWRSGESEHCAVGRQDAGCSSLRSGPHDCGSSGNDGVHTYQRVQPLACPEGSQQVGEANADWIGGGMGWSSPATIEECREICRKRSGCLSYMWAPVDGHYNKIGQNITVCKLVASETPNSVYGPNGIFCKLEATR